MLRSLSIALAAALALSVGQADAAVEATSRTEISNFSIVPISGTGSISAGGFTTEANNLSVSLDGFGSIAPGFQPGLDGTLLFLGAVPGDAPADNSFPVPVGGITLPYVFADSDGGGNVLTGDATATTMSSIGSPVVSTKGAGSSTDQLVEVGVLISGGPITFTFSFDADVDLLLENSGAVPPLQAVAASSFGITILGTADDGEKIDLGTDDILKADDVDALNNFLELPPGPDTYDFDETVISQEITLGPGNYTFSLSQTNNVRLQALVPEPTTVAVWSLLGVGACAARRRGA